MTLRLPTIASGFMAKYYSGIGSRETPNFVCGAMRQIAYTLEAEGYTLRSGGAGGADSAFEEGVMNNVNKEIYLPWKGFNKSKSPYYGVCDAAIAMALSVHPSPDTLIKREKALHLHARNCYQVLGSDLATPSDFVICCTEDAQKRGGTRTAIVIAERNKIPVLNFGKCETYEQCMTAFDRFYLLVA